MFEPAVPVVPDRSSRTGANNKLPRFLRRKLPPGYSPCSNPGEPEILAEAVRRFDNSRFDQHLAHRDVDLRDQHPDVFEARGRVLNEQHVRTGIDDGTAALREHPLILVGQQLLHSIRFLIIQLEAFGPHGLQVADLLTGLEFQLSLVAISSRGATRITLPFLRMSRPRC